MVEVSQLSRHILRELCMNSRVTITELAKKFSISRHVITERIEVLEKEFGLRYTIEPNYEALGFNDLHVVRLKFNKKPKPDVLKEIFAKSRVAQLVAITMNGDLDAIIFAVAKSPTEYSGWETALNMTLSKYGVQIRQSEINIFHLGFIPIDEGVINASNQEPIYKKMLNIINNDSRISIRDLSRQMGTSEALTRYYFRELDRSKLIRRYTAILTKSPLKVDIVYFINYTIKSGIERRVERERRTMYWKQLQEFPLVSEFPLMLSTSGGDRSFTLANYDDYKKGIAQSVSAHLAAYREDEPIVKQAVIETVIKGNLPIRNVDQKETYGVVEWNAELI